MQQSVRLYVLNDKSIVNMLMQVLITVLILATVDAQDDNLEHECNVLQTLDSVVDRLIATITDVAILKSAVVNAESKIGHQNTDIRDFKDDLADMKTEIGNLKDSLVAAESRIDLHNAIATRLENSLTNAEGLIEQQRTEIATLKISLSSAKTEIENWKVTEPLPKTNVVFYVNGVSGYVTEDSPVLFRTVVDNIDHAYNLTTGCFAAPTSGVYWFHAQMCTGSSMIVSPSIYIRGSLANRVRVGDRDWASCGSVSAVGVLEAGDEACLGAGPVVGSGDSPTVVWDEPAYNTNSFMGVRIN